MNKKAHFNPKSVTWLISLAVMAVVCVGVIFGSKAIYNAANKKYIEHVEPGFTISSTEEIDVSSMNISEYGVTKVQEAYDSSGNVVAYVVDGKVTGYNTAVPIEMSTVITADTAIVCSVDILHQEETEYLGVRIETPEFKKQFEGRYFPVISSKSLKRGSKIDVLAGATVSSEAVIEGTAKAQKFVADNLAPAPAENN